MRVTFNAVRDGLGNIQSAQEQYADTQWQVSSGLRVRVPSDDPLSAQRAIQDQNQVSGLDAYSQIGDSASARLSSLDSTLGDIVTRLTQALTAAHSAQGTAVSQTTRDAAASTLLAARDAIAGDINTTFNGAYLFSGSNASVQPYSNGSGSWVYQGDANPVTVSVDPNRTVTIGVDGQSVLKGGDTTDVLTVLDSLATAAQAGDEAGLAAGVDALNRAFSRATTAQTRVGLDENTLADGTDHLSTLRMAATTQLSNDQDANLADAITKMNQAQIAYQSALGAVSTASKTSLLDYLR